MVARTASSSPSLDSSQEDQSPLCSGYSLGSPCGSWIFLGPSNAGPSSAGMSGGCAQENCPVCGDCTCNYCISNYGLCQCHDVEVNAEDAAKIALSMGTEAENAAYIQSVFEQRRLASQQAVAERVQQIGFQIQSHHNGARGSTSPGLHHLRRRRANKNDNACRKGP